MRNEILIDIFDKIPYKAKEIILSKENYNLIEDISLMLDYLASPIEIILYTALIKKMNELNFNLYIEAQTEIKCKNGKNYRTDISIFGDEIINSELNENFKLDIECDGYEFHQKTKEQVKRDNEREYDLKIEGWEILRFSGSQIYNEPMKCAEDILKYVIDKNNIKLGDE